MYSNWLFRNLLSEFVRYPTPHNGDNSSTTLFEILLNWYNLRNIDAKATDNLSVMCCDVGNLCTLLNIRNHTWTGATDLLCNVSISLTILKLTTV